MDTWGFDGLIDWFGGFILGAVLAVRLEGLLAGMGALVLGDWRKRWRLDHSVPSPDLEDSEPPYRHIRLH